MKLTRQEILLLGAVLFALVTGGAVKHHRAAHPAETPAPRPLTKK